MISASEELVLEAPGPSGKPSREWLIPVAAISIALVVAFWPLFRWLPTIWFGDDTYYAHGAVVPICVGLLIWDRWPSIRNIPVKPSNWPLIPISILLFAGWVANRTDMRTFQSIIMVMLLMCSVWFVAGRKWFAALAIPIGYLAFGLPIFDRVVDSYTQWIQRWSTDLSYVLLKVLQLNPYRIDHSTILVERFSMNIGIACSGMKLLLAVSSISIFFILIAKLNWWKNLILLLSAVPMALIVNAIRIVMIGVVGSNWGDEAGHQFHDYSGYISLVISFLILLKLTKVLGWKS